MTYRFTARAARTEIDPDTLEDLRLDDSEIEAVIEAPAEDIVQFREVLAQVLNYGRPDAVPSRLAV